ncbi:MULTISPECIES: threonine-phosphate decarboxylase CobD [Anoxybacillus]|uniref:threonine-phosphate decarboxylase n=1 Tax=Anoxybacillus flavithermus TaxID=33934 RepID=A0A178TCT3_9BACL|nr:threonine-phosphate decarboxylase CobD [Anoxybacillus flavithermus]ASA95637.1 threonine-phosphate decarboxylase [Anoxybacillus flavithermus]MBE2904379.1 threonine-phosphate decarboxylase [Anoxybacillus flavithermus]MBE2907408.1 threonine-phosphate decarboxylase [Anoxybacillus flavithermus]MBE2910156.1 threonine-phosphate decarboxylase [Anoxybacillus flavithermus]MBE2912504.1 threonine-phosphate decarboxylase [Anoxybacillus flavithermus]
MQLPAHGANPRRLYEAMHMDMPSSYIDFSVNVNPFPLPDEYMPTEQQWVRWMSVYPEERSETLRAIIAEREHVTRSNVFVGNGAAECIYLLAEQFAGKRIGIIEPTFSEYRQACEAYGCTVHSFMLDEHWQPPLDQMVANLPSLHALFVCHPNNPTGTAWSEETMHTLLNAAHDEGVYVVVDEAFYDFWIDGYSVSSFLRTFDRLIVLRSLTKMYRLAGVRLGYVLAHEHVVKKLMKKQPPWSVNTIAQQIAKQLLKDDAFVERTKVYIASERKRVFEQLNELGYKYSPSVVNFYMLYDETITLFPFLLQHGIVARHTFNFRGLDGKYVRFAVRTKEENDHLLFYLRRWKQ